MSVRLGSSQRRLRIGFLFIAFVVSVFGGRLLQLQGVEASSYATQAMKARLDTVTLHAERGDITDSNGVSLASTVDTVAVSADPKLTRADAPRIANLLAPLLDVSVLELEKNLQQPDTRFVYLARHVQPNIWSKAERRLEKAGFSGVWADPDPLRNYPTGGVASNVLGFVGSEGEGLAGLEYSLDDSLGGKDGWARYERAAGRQIPLGKSLGEDPVPGTSYQLTIDRDVQWAAQQAIADQVKATDAESGSVVVLDSKTGELRALATAPGFDPEKITKAPPEDRGNRPLDQAYEPGSVAKLITAGALLDGGYVTPGTKITVPGALNRNGKEIGDWWTHGTIRLTFAGAIAKSSNIGTVLAAEKMPKDEHAEYLRKFGLGEPTGIGFPGETEGIVPDAGADGSGWADLQRATISFGQGISVNAVQMASVLGTVANDGKRVEPQLVAGSIQDGELDPADPPKSERVISPKSAEQVTAMMEAVTGPDGVAQKATIEGYRVAGKTGTAQRVDPECGCYRGYSSSFGGFAPADDGRYVVYVVVHDPQGSNSGSEVAAPVFHDVMSFVLQKYGIPPTGESSPDLRLEW